MEKRVLGRGLAALIPETPAGNRIDPNNAQEIIISLPIDKIRANKYQPRGDFEENALKDLAASIKEKGFLQPVLVRVKDGEYELIAGERRYRAAKMLSLKEIPALIKNVEDIDSLELSIIENIQREDLNPIDEAKAYKRLSEEFKLAQESIADTVGKDRATVANILRLLKLPQKIQEYVSRGTLSMGHARAILSLTNIEQQMRICTKIVKEDLSVREVEKYTKNLAENLSRTGKGIAEKDPNLTALEQSLKEFFGTKVNIAKKGKKGTITIEFYSDADLDRVITLLKSKS